MTSDDRHCTPEDASFIKYHYDQTYRELLTGLGIVPHEGITVADAQWITDFAEDVGCSLPHMLSMPPLTTYCTLQFSDGGGLVCDFFF